MDALPKIKGEVVYKGPLMAPVKEGDIVGELVVTAPGMPDKKIPVAAGKSVNQLGLLGKAMLGLRAKTTRKKPRKSRIWRREAGSSRLKGARASGNPRWRRLWARACGARRQGGADARARRHAGRGSDQTADPQSARGRCGMGAYRGNLAVLCSAPRSSRQADPSCA